MVPYVQSLEKKGNEKHLYISYISLTFWKDYVPIPIYEEKHSTKKQVEI